MEKRKIFPNFVKIAALDNSYMKFPQCKLQLNNNSTMYAPDAQLITVLSEALDFKFDILQPNDSKYGELEDGNWTGFLGMLQRKEVDLIVASLSPTFERSLLLDVSYPYQYAYITFITDKPKYVVDMSAIFHPFSLSLWITIVAFLLLLQPLLYVFKIKNYSFQNVLFKTFGSLLEKAVDIKMKKMSTKLLILTWVVGAMFITQSYKAVLLSFLTFPSLTGIRDIEQLAKAADKSSFMCSTYATSKVDTERFLSGDESWKKIGRCLQRSDSQAFDVESFLQPSTYQKAFIGVKFHLNSFRNEYFISEDVFYYDFFVIGIQKSFCCKDLLEDTLLRLAAAGIFVKFDRVNEFFMTRKKYDYENENSLRKLSLADFSTAFIILVIGYILGFAALATEICFERKMESF